MEYEALLKKCDNLYEYEGSIIIDINNVGLLRVAYLAPYEFAKKYLKEKNKIMVDLWFIYGIPVKIDNYEKYYCSDLIINGGKIKGEIKSVLSSTEFRVDCGTIIDIKSDKPINDINESDFIEVEGTYQIYFPGTDWSR